MAREQVMVVKRAHRTPDCDRDDSVLATRMRDFLRQVLRFA
jgi:hypothetical protein